MNLLIQFCAEIFLMIVRRAPEGNINVKQMIELGVLPLLYFSDCLRKRFAVFHRGARIQQNINRICPKTQLEPLCIWRSLVLHRSRGECRPMKKDKMS